LVGISSGIVLMVVLGLVKPLERFERRCNRLRKNVSRVELLDVQLRCTTLLLIGIKDGRAILPADIIALSVEMGRIVGNGEENFQNLPVGPLAGVVFDLHSLGVIRRSATNSPIVRGFFCPACISGGHADDTVQLTVHGLYAPKATAGENYGFNRSGRCNR